MDESLRQRLEDALLLPADHADRSSALAAAARDPAAHEYLRRLEAEHALLTAALRDVPADPAFLDRLAARPPEAPVAPLGPAADAVRRRRLNPWMSSAAAAVLIVLIGLGANRLVGYLNAQQMQATLTAVAEVAARWHQATPQDLTESSDPRAVAAALRPHLPWQPLVLTLGPAKLEGAGVRKATRFGDAPVAYTRWAFQNHRYTLYQFASRDLRLPAEFDPQVEHVNEPSGPLVVHVWSNGSFGCTWALVQDAAAPTIYTPTLQYHW